MPIATFAVALTDDSTKLHFSLPILRRIFFNFDKRIRTNTQCFQSKLTESTNHNKTSRIFLLELHNKQEIVLLSIFACPRKCEKKNPIRNRWHQSFEAQIIHMSKSMAKQISCIHFINLNISRFTMLKIIACDGKILQRNFVYIAKSQKWTECTSKAKIYC